MIEDLCLAASGHPPHTILTTPNGGQCVLALNGNHGSGLRPVDPATAWRFVQAVAEWLLVWEGPGPSVGATPEHVGLSWLDTGHTEFPAPRGAPFSGAAKLFLAPGNRDDACELYFHQDEPGEARFAEKDESYRGPLVRCFRAALVDSMSEGVGTEQPLTPELAARRLGKILFDGVRSHDLVEPLSRHVDGPRLVQALLENHPKGEHAAAAFGLLACLGDVDAPLSLLTDEHDWIGCICWLAQAKQGHAVLERHREAVTTAIENLLDSGGVCFYSPRLLRALGPIAWARPLLRRALELDDPEPAIDALLGLEDGGELDLTTIEQVLGRARASDLEVKYDFRWRELLHVRESRLGLQAELRACLIASGFEPDDLGRQSSNG